MTLLMPLNRIWHAFTYNVWFPYRYSFCLTFYMIYIAYKSFLNIKEIELKNVWKIFLMIIGVYFIIEKFNYEYIVSELIYCTIFMMFAGCIAIKLIKNNEKSAYLLLAVVMCAEMIVNTASYLQCFGYTNRNEFYANRTELSNKLASINDKGYYRIENDVVKDGNSAMGYKYLGVSSSSTMGKENSRGLMESLGYTRVANNSIKYEPTTKFADNFLGIKYFISDEVTKNDDALSLGFMANKSVAEIDDFLTKWGEHSNSFEKQNELVNSMTGIEDNLYKKVQILDKQTENLEKIEDGKYKKMYPRNKAFYSFYFNAPNENEIYLKTSGETVDRAKLYVNNEEICEYMVIDNYSVINLGGFGEGEKVKVDIEFINAESEIIFKDIWVYYEDIEVYNLAMEKLKENQLNIKSITDNKLEGEIEVTKDDELLLFSIPYDKYLSVYVDNERAQVICVLDSLISVPLEKGNHTIMVKYEPDYFSKVVLISGMFVLLAVVNILLEYKRKEV